MNLHFIYRDIGSWSYFNFLAVMVVRKHRVWYMDAILAHYQTKGLI